MADVAFDSNKHAQTRQDVEHGGAAIASSSEAIARLTDGQNERFWTDEAGPQALRNAFIAFLGACGDIATNERDTLRSFGRNVDQAIEDFAALEQATGDELKALRDSMGTRRPTHHRRPLPRHLPGDQRQVPIPRRRLAPMARPPRKHRQSSDPRRTIGDRPW
mgnify:CR=1 FL=1